MEQVLLAYLSCDFEPSDVDVLRQSIAALADESWTIEAPQFVDECDEESCDDPEDDPRTVGAILLTGQGSLKVPVGEVRLFITTLASFTALRKLECELELDGTYVGDIKAGAVSRLIEVGLLATW